MTNPDIFTLCESPTWRIRNLYHIIDKKGIKTKFSPNWAQERLEKDIWYCNIILKARQLGISTYICMLFLDRCLFNSNKAAGIICHTREDSEYMFKRIKFAYENLPQEIRSERIAKSDSARELVFNNGSSLRVGTSMRGSTLQYLHISEFGKICAKYPDKAEEIITGSLNTIAPGQYVFIESTAEGREGYFYDLCRIAENQKKMDAVLTKMDFKFHFFPWWEEPAYRIGSQVVMTQEDLDYFESLRSRGITIDNEQKWWYALKKSTQGDNMYREYPSTPDEAWESAVNGAYYANQISLARLEKRISFIPYESDVPVHTAWDLGYNDSTAIWFFQVVCKEIHLIEYIEGSGESLAHWLGVVQSKKYVYGMHLAPHDIMVKEYSTGMSRKESARKLGITFIASSRVDIIPGIDAVRILLNRCFFDEKKCIDGMRCLENYKKKWNDRTGNWMSEPLHDQYSHGADAFRTLATGLSIIVNTAKIPQQDFGRTLGYKPNSQQSQHSNMRWQ